MDISVKIVKQLALNPHYVLVNRWNMYLSRVLVRMLKREIGLQLSEDLAFEISGLGMMEKLFQALITQPSLKDKLKTAGAML